MILEGDLGKQFIEAVRYHVGHDLEVVTYEKDGEPVNYSIECRDCHEVIIDADVEE